MHKLLLSLLIILSFSFTANAQLTKGNFLLGGTLSYGGSSVSNSGISQTNHSGNFNISLGKAINENSVFGINLLYGFTNNEPISNKINVYSLGVFYRKYKALGKDFYIFGEAGAGYNNSKQSSKDISGVEYSSFTANGAYMSFYPGFDYKISKKFFLEISIPSLFFASYYSTTTTDQNTNPETTKGNQFGVITSLSTNPLQALGIGFRLIL